MDNLIAYIFFGFWIALPLTIFLSWRIKRSSDRTIADEKANHKSEMRLAKMEQAAAVKIAMLEAAAVERLTALQKSIPNSSGGADAPLEMTPAYMGVLQTYNRVGEQNSRPN